MTSGGPLAIPDIDDVYPIIPKWKSARILHFGDSHVAAGLKASLARHFQSAGAVFHQEGWIGSRSKSWISSGRLKRLLSDFKPSIVVVTLGTNEMRNRRPKRNRIWVRAIIEKIGKAKCYWVGPPPLIVDRTGYTDMLKDATHPCRFFDSRVLDMAPRSDGTFHLTASQGRRWGDRIWRWMNGE